MQRAQHVPNEDIPGLHEGHAQVLARADAARRPSTMAAVRTILRTAAAFPQPLTSPRTCSMAHWSEDSELVDCELGFELRFSVGKRALTVIVLDTGLAWVCMDDLEPWEGPIGGAMQVVRPWLQVLATHARFTTIIAPARLQSRSR